MLLVKERGEEIRIGMENRQAGPKRLAVSMGDFLRMDEPKGNH